MNIWDLHSGTLGLSSALLTSSTAAMAFIMGRSNPVGAQAARSWGWTMTAAASAFLLWFLGPGLGRWADFVLGNIVAVIFSVLLIRSMYLLVGRSIPPRWLLGQFCVGVFGIACVQLAAAPRGVAVVTIALSFLFGGLGSILAIARNPSTRASNWGRALMAVLATWCLVVIGARLYALFLGGGADAVRPLASTHVQAAALCAGTLMLVVASLGFLGILADQQRQAALESSRRDGLTGTLTRAAFFEQAHQQARASAPYSIVMLDVDFFKKFNDSYGHLGGDAVLRHVALQLQRLVRSADLVGRYGGEEFCVLLPACDAAEAYKVASRICQESARHPARLPDGRSVAYTVSIGLATADTDQVRAGLPELEHTIDQADQALYRAKSLGRNQVQVFTLPQPLLADEPPPRGPLALA